MEEPEFNINEITVKFLEAKSNDIVKSAKSTFNKFDNTLTVKFKSIFLCA